jgi:hypothetical protein
MHSTPRAKDRDRRGVHAFKQGGLDVIYNINVSGKNRGFMAANCDFGVYPP